MGASKDAVDMHEDVQVEVAEEKIAVYRFVLSLCVHAMINII